MKEKSEGESLSIPPGGSYPVSGIINMRWPGQYVGPHRQEIQIISLRNPKIYPVSGFTDQNLNLYFVRIHLQLTDQSKPLLPKEVRSDLLFTPSLSCEY